MIVDPEIAALVERLLVEHPPGTSDPTEFFGARFDAGLAWVHYPSGAVGAAPTRSNTAPWKRRWTTPGHRRASPSTRSGSGWSARPSHNTAPRRSGSLPEAAVHGRGNLVPAVLGTRCRLGPRELATRAERDGDEWVVNGQKVWTSLGHKAHFGLLFARTDVDAPKNHGLTTFLVDMHAPGCRHTTACGR